MYNPNYDPRDGIINPFLIDHLFTSIFPPWMDIDIQSEIRPHPEREEWGKCYIYLSKKNQNIASKKNSWFVTPPSDIADILPFPSGGDPRRVDMKIPLPVHFHPTIYGVELSLYEDVSDKLSKWYIHSISDFCRVLRIEKYVNLDLVSRYIETALMMTRIFPYRIEKCGRMFKR